MFEAELEIVLKNISHSISFLNIALVKEKSPKSSGGFGCYRHEWINPLMLTGAKSSLTNLTKSFQQKKDCCKHLKRKCELKGYQQLSFKYFVNSCPIQNVLAKVS